jgi:hypothetical protein
LLPPPPKPVPVVKPALAAGLTLATKLAPKPVPGMSRPGMPGASRYGAPRPAMPPTNGKASSDTD